MGLSKSTQTFLACSHYYYLYYIKHPGHFCSKLCRGAFYLQSFLNMPKTSLKQKFLLLIFSLVLCIVLLEILLRIAGAVVYYLQQKHNHVSFNNQEYRILCLGESTTALGGEDSYPSQLQQMLNTQSPSKKFTVINEGIISTNTSYIQEHADYNLDKYKPQLVIVMMGINDRFFLHQHSDNCWENFKSFIEEMRVYKLCRLIVEHAAHRVKGSKIASAQPESINETRVNPEMLENFLKHLINQDIMRIEGHLAFAFKDQQQGQMLQAEGEKKLAQQAAYEAGLGLIQLSLRYRIKGDLDQAEALLIQAHQFDPNNSDLYFEWGKIYMEKNEYADAIKAFQEAYSLNHDNKKALQGLAHAYYMAGEKSQAFLIYEGYLQLCPDDYWGYIEIAHWLRENQHYPPAENYLTHAITVASYIDQAYLDYGETLDDEKKYDQEESFYLKEIALNPKIPQLYQALGQFYRDRGKEGLAKKYFQQAALPQVAEYYPITLTNYNSLLNKILNRHIKIIVMQYPLRDITPIENYLGPRNNVFYVENKHNFKEALAKEGYNYYFKDNFGNDFGHCTHAGNKLIAQNLSEVILTKIEP